jgi:hypothetical protein
VCNAGIESLVFGFVPLRFLEGETLFRWSRSRFFGALSIAFWAYAQPRAARKRR